MHAVIPARHLEVMLMLIHKNIQCEKLSTHIFPNSLQLYNTLEGGFDNYTKPFSISTTLVKKQEVLFYNNDIGGENGQ